MQYGLSRQWSYILLSFNRGEIPVLSALSYEYFTVHPMWS